MNAHLILHIGSHKTGTTSLQSALRQSSDTLAQADVGYVGRHSAGKPVVQITGTKDTFRATLRPGIADRLFRPKAGTTILSEEQLFWISDPEQTHILAELIRKRFDSVTVIAYLRRQDRMVLSHRKQLVLGWWSKDFYGSDAMTLPEPQPYMNSVLDFHRKITDCWQSAFGARSIILRHYERDTLRNRDIVADFSAVTGIPIRPLTEDRNKPLTGRQLLVGYALANLQLDPEEMRPILDDVLAKLGPDQEPILPTRAEARRFVDYFAQANARLAQSFHLEGEPFRFSEDYSMYPEAEDPKWTSCEVLALLRFLHARKSG